MTSRILGRWWCGPAIVCSLAGGCRAGELGSARTTEPPATDAKKEDIHVSNYHKPSEQDLRARLTPQQFDVTQREATEAPFQNAYWNNHHPGLYVDVVSGEPLFSSLDKFDSGTGWPSFTRPIEDGHLTTRTDRRLLMARTEVRSRLAGSHLGHVFDDGPAPTGLRYCMNSAALRFVPVERLAEEGYGQYLHLFGAGAATTAIAGDARH